MGDREKVSLEDERLDLALKASNEGIWDWDLPTGEIYYTNRLLMFLGFGRMGAPNIFVEVEKFIHPDDLEGFQAKMDRVLVRKGILFASESRIRTKEGEWKWFRVRGVPVRDPNGVVIRMVGSLIDISERKRAELQLAEERARIDLVLESAPVSVYLKDLGGRYVRANAATAVRLRVGSVKELLGKVDGDFFESEYALATRAAEVQIMETGEEQEEELVHEVLEGGEASWALVTKKVWRGLRGEVKGVFGLSHDVTELMEAQEDLSLIAQELKTVHREISDERHLLRMVIDNIPAVVYFKDLDSNFVLVNRGMANLVGESTPEMVVGRNDSDYFGTELTLSARSDEVVIMRTGKPMEQKFETVHWKDGRVTWSLTSKYAWIDGEGQVKGTYGVSMDVTPLIEARKELERIAGVLERKNESFEAQLNLAREVQQSAFPEVIPSLSYGERQVACHHVYRPASKLAGDFFEVFEVAEGVCGFLVCDVMGHGVRSALIVSMLRGLVEKQRETLGGKPGEFLTGLNGGLVHLLERASQLIFSSAIYGVIDLKENEMRVASAGHPAPILQRDGELGVLEMSGALKGPALGMVGGFDYGEMVVSLEGFGTEGVFEVVGEGGEEFGLGRMCEVLKVDEGLKEALGNLVEKALDFGEGEAFEDDVCVLGVEVVDL